MRRSQILTILFFSLMLSDTFAQDKGLMKSYPVQTVSIGRSTAPPALDGVLSEGEWSGTRLSDFVLTNGARGERAKQPTHCYLSYDDEFLYIAVIAFEADTGRIRAGSSSHDTAEIFYDDRIELFLDVNHDHRSYYNFVVNPAGGTLDQQVLQPLPGTRTHNVDPAWNAFWRSAVVVSADRWTAEIAIELRSLGIAAISNGTTIGFNIGRARLPQVQPGEASRTFTVREPSEYSAWAFVQDFIWETVSNFNAPESFGDLTFGDTGVMVTGLRFPNASFNGGLGSTTLQGMNPFEMSFTNQGVSQSAELHLSVSVPVSEEQKFVPGVGERVTWRKAYPINSSDSVVRAGYYVSHEKENKLNVSLVDRKSGAVLYQTSYILLVPPFLKYDLAPLYNKSASAQPVTFSRNFGGAEGRGIEKLSIQLLGDDNRELAGETFTDLSGIDGKQTIFSSLDFGKIADQNLTIRSTLLAERGDTLHASDQPVTTFRGKSNAVLEAVEEEYAYGGLQGHAVVIRFPFNARFVFWKLASYVPWWDLDQATTSNEFVEAWGGGLEGCAEPLQDRACKFSSVSIVENTPARVKVKWRYALNDAHYRIYENEWVDEYYTFYPDGTGIREVNLYANTDTEHEVFEAIYVNPPGVSTYELFDPEIMTLGIPDGNPYPVRELGSDPELRQELFASGKPVILESHFKDRMHPFTVFAFDNAELLPRVLTEKISLARNVPPGNTRRGHWPASRYDVDGYNAVGDDRPGHFNLGNIHVMASRSDRVNRWIFMIGVYDPEASQATPRQKAANWLNPPELVPVRGNAPAIRYDKEQGAYVIGAFPKRKSVSFRLPKERLAGPVFIFGDKTPTDLKSVLVNGKQLDQKGYTSAMTGKGLCVFVGRDLVSGDQISVLWN